MSGWVFEVCVVNDHEDSKNPLVSVGIPTYNRPDGLRRTLNCITKQTYQNLEIIVSNNCSPELDTELVVREFMAKDCRIFYYRQQENKGPIFNFEFVREKATGEYFMWAADDDEWDLDYITELLKLHQTGQFVLTACGCYLVDINYSNINLKQIPADVINKGQYDAFLFFLLSHHWGYCKANIIYGLYRRSAIIDIPFAECSLDIGADIIFILRVISKGPICYSPDKKMIKHLPGIIHPNNQIKHINLISLSHYPRYIFFKNSNNHYKEIDEFSSIIDDIIKTTWTGYPALILRLANRIYQLRLIALF